MIFRALLGAVVVAAAAFPALAQTYDLYAVSGAGGAASSLYKLNPNTGAVISTAAIPITDLTTGNPLSLSAIFYNSQDGVLYGTTNNSSFNAKSLVKINIGSGVATLQGAAGAMQVTMQGATISTTGIAYGYTKDANSLSTPTHTAEALYTINLGNGTTQFVGNSGQSPTSGDGLAINSAGALYLAGAGASGSLYNLDTNTSGATPGKATAVTFTTGTGTTTNMSGAPISAGTIKGMVFDNNDKLYGINLANGSMNPAADLVTINLTTGAITNMSNPANPQPGLTGLAFVPVPEPSTLTISLAVGVYFWRRSRRKK